MTSADQPTSTDQPDLPDPMRLAHAVAAIAERSQRTVLDFLERQQASGTQVPSLDPLNIAGAFIEMNAKLLADPAELMQAHMSLWSDYMRLWQRTAERFLGVGDPPPVIEAASSDKRFRDAAWQDNAVFDFVKQSYLLSARYLQHAVHPTEGLDAATQRKVDFYTRQFVDAMAPSNFVLTNPTVLKATVDSGGENLLKGLEHLLEDLERGRGSLDIKMTDDKGFRLGETIATTPGKIVFENALLQLIQYEPSTETVHRRPLLLVPAWINKYYILDLRPQNSFARWAVEQGHTVFIVSWVNPDKSMAEKTFEDYVEDGLIAALGAVLKATGEPEANVLGYCIGGTLLATTAAYLAAKGDTRIASLTFLTTMLDFAEAGDLSVFVDEAQIAALEAKMEQDGVLEGAAMAKTFNLLRANDLIWSFVVNNYLLGKDPFPFDLLYWNSDATRMPRAMHAYYLRRMYQENRLIEPAGITIRDMPIDLALVRAPAFALGTREDHIAPWKSCYASVRRFSGEVTFCLSAAGHVAGVINPPAANKYNYWLNPERPPEPDAWLAEAAPHPGSWWLAWAQWIAGLDDRKVAARVPGDGALPVLGDAPGSYVRVRSD